MCKVPLIIMYSRHVCYILHIHWLAFIIVTNLYKSIFIKEILTTEKGFASGDLLPEDATWANGWFGFGVTKWTNDLVKVAGIQWICTIARPNVVAIFEGRQCPAVILKNAIFNTEFATKLPHFAIRSSLALLLRSVWQI